MVKWDINRKKNKCKWEINKKMINVNVKTMKRKIIKMVKGKM